MPRLLTLALMLGSLALLPACGGGDEGRGDADAGETGGSDDAGNDGSETPTSPSSPREQTVQALLDKMNKFPEILSEVKDDASAKTASDKLTDLAQSIKPLVEKWGGFGEMSNEEASSIESKYKQQIIGFEEKLQNQIKRITGLNPLLLPKVQEGMKAIKDALGDFDIDG